MVSESSEAFATRIPAEDAKRLEEAIQQTNASASSVIERALQYYSAKNPDNIPAFQPDATDLGPLQQAKILPEDLGNEIRWEPLFE